MKEFEVGKAEEDMGLDRMSRKAKDVQIKVMDRGEVGAQKRNEKKKHKKKSCKEKGVNPVGRTRGSHVRELWRGASKEVR